MRGVVLMFAALLGGCSFSQIGEQTATREERGFARASVEALRGGDPEQVRQMADASLQAALTPAEVADTRERLPAGEPRLLSVIVHQDPSGAPGTTVKTFSYEMGGSPRWTLVQVSLQTAPQPVRIVGYQINPSDDQPSARMAFAAAPRSVIHYLWLVAMAVSLLVSIAGAVTAARSRGGWRKWLWAAGSLISVFTFTLDWAHGGVTIQPLQFLLAGVSAIQPNAMAPWYLSFAIPLVAIVVLVRQARRRAAA